ncbi:MAG: DUF1361 domain-containing protein [Caldilineaceae bacterium]
MKTIDTLYNFVIDHRERLLLIALLFLSTLLSIVMVGFRVMYSNTWTYLFLIWNLFLAWTPLYCAILLWWLVRWGFRSSFMLLPVVGVWLAFFPNAPYIVTDFLHLAPRQNIPMWYDLMLIFSFAWNGLSVGYASLWIMQNLAEQLYGRLMGWLLVVGTLAVSGFGIYIGRFLRWNSWDFLTDPHGLLHDIAPRLLNPLEHPQTAAVSLLFSTFLLLSYLTMTMLIAAKWQPTLAATRK